MTTKLRTTIEIAIGVIALGAVSYGVYVSSSLQEMKKIDSLKGQLAESIQREQQYKSDFLECQTVMENAHKGAEEERALQLDISKQLNELLGLQ